MDSERFPTPAQAFTDAVCASADLSTVEAMVLLAYARAAKRGADSSWLTQRRLMRECKIASTATVVKVRHSLIEKGWLVPVDVVMVRGGQITVCQLANPEPCSLSEPGWDGSDSLAKPGEGQSGSLTEPHDVRSGSLAEQGDRPGSLTEQGDDQPGSLTEPLYNVKRFTSEADPVHSVHRRGSLSEQRISPQDGPPFRGGSMSGARGGAQAHARTREASEDQNHLSMNGKETLTRDEALSLLRRTLPSGKPLSRYPDEPSTDVDQPRGPSTNVDDPPDGDDPR